MRPVYEVLADRFDISCRVRGANNFRPNIPDQTTISNIFSLVMILRLNLLAVDFGSKIIFISSMPLDAAWWLDANALY